MIVAELLKILCCPDTHQELRTLKNRAGQPIKEKIDDGLVRTDGKYLYPVRRNIPVMLVDEAIPLN
jgi:uncharacterized protein YbaR (Trm112 family)